MAGGVILFSSVVTLPVTACDSANHQSPTLEYASNTNKTQGLIKKKKKKRYESRRYMMERRVPQETEGAKKR